MKKQIRQLLLHQDHMAFQSIVPVVVIIVLLAGVLTALLLNTAGLKERLRQNTVSYADDVSAQLASNISSRMQMREIYISNLADTLSRMPESLLTEELLDRKAEYLEMDKIFIVNADGTTSPADVEYAGLATYIADNPTIYTDAQIFFAEHDAVFFSAPILWDSGEHSLLIGVRTVTLLQQMLQEVDFKEQGLSCIVDKDGTMVVSATDDVPFQELGDIFHKDIRSEDAEEAKRVLEDISVHRSGVAEFRDVGGEPIMLGYDFLGINDWMLLTLLPSDLFSKGTQAYLIHYAVITVVMALVMLLIFAAVVWYYRRTLKYIKTVALRDSLTGGPNELAFRLGGESLLQENPQQSFAIVYLNIQNFKRFNERFGTKTGDELLKQVYRVLLDYLGERELIARTSGDHFYLLLACADEETVRRRLYTILGQLKQTLSEQFSIDQPCFDLGAYLIRERDADFMILSDRAKVASAYQQESSGCKFYDAALAEQIEREHSLDESFKSAIENREFQIYIQPKFCPERKQIFGGEVLVRWQSQEYGLLLPGEFVPLFERNGKICDLDFYMFEETCRLLKGWLAEGCAVPLSVNLSRAHLRSSDLSFLERFKAIKEAHQIPDGFIELELTESLMLERRERHLVMAMINRIQEMGFLCSIDDFGFGHSSLTMLKDLNVTTVKLDRQFFLDENNKSWVVVRQLIQLAHDLGMSVVAEGIEEQEQVEKLREYGCDLIQGYVYAKPMPVSDFERYLTTV